MQQRKAYVLAFDTSNEVVSIGLGTLDAAHRRVECTDSRSFAARRASNTQLLPRIDELLRDTGVQRGDIACVACGRGPGSFTGVRICIATAKGVAEALEVPLVGVSTMDAVAWGVHASGYRGRVLVLADAMRKEVYPVDYAVSGAGIVRMNADVVVKAQVQADRLAEGDGLLIAGDALAKYADLFAGKGAFAEKGLWTATGAGLLAALQNDWNKGAADPFDRRRHDPAVLLPVYTRLSDAEENERARLAEPAPRNLRTGVQAARDAGGGPAVRCKPLDAAHAQDVADIEVRIMGTDAWSAALVEDDLRRRDRSWWAAFDEETGRLAAYAGGMVADGRLQVLKVGCDPAYRRRGIARKLLLLVCGDARNLGAETITLEVRASNVGAQAFYAGLGMRNLGRRPGYYSDREDAFIYEGPLPSAGGDVAGMDLMLDRAAADGPVQARTADGSSDGAEAPAQGASGCAAPLILAIESSCDETAAAVVDGRGTILADTVASQIDFHARFGGVVPEIASRKHVEAICGVSQVCLEHAAERLGRDRLRWRDLDAVAVTYAPGLLGALVVGVAFAKGAAWGADIPLIGVNHLEGHLYANKIAEPGIAPPMVVSLVSGGNTMLVHVRDWGDYRVMGETIDDAVGEAFDKVAKALGLGYPGGPVISRYAEKGDPRAIAFPRAMLHSGDLRFSLSGLKTAVITYIDGERAAGREPDLPDVCASFQAAVIDVQVAKATTALEQTGAREFCLGGGVAANAELRRAYEKACGDLGVRLTMPPLSACTDNAAMIGLVALDRFRKGRFFGLDADASARADLEQPY